MGQYFILINHTTGERKSVGAVGDFSQEIASLGWAPTDWVEAMGDHGYNIHFNDPHEVPEEFVESFERSEWQIVIYAAERLGVKPEEFANDYLYPDEQEEESISSAKL